MNLFSGFDNAEPQEVPTASRMEVEGEIPSELRGVLYRNGPGQYTNHGDRYRHLFDGDGLATRISFEQDGVFYTSRFVQSKEKQQEDSAGKRIFGTYAMRPVGGPLSRFIHREFKNVSNTNLVYQWDAVFAMYEGGPPYRMDPLTLDTIGAELFNGRLADQQKVSAHPHRDPRSGDLWNFGLTRKKDTTITVYNMKRTGEFDVPFQLVIPYSGIVHDFALTENYLVFVVPPVKLPKIPLGVIFGQRSFFESLAFYPEEPTCVILVDRRTGKETRLFAETFMNFHIANAWEQEGAVFVDLCNFEDFGVMKTMEDLIQGTKPAETVSYLERLMVEGDTVTRERLSNTSMEFPRVVESGFGTRRKYYYGASWADRDWMSVPMRYDLETGACQLAPLEPHQYAGEPVPVPKTNGDADSAWLLFTVLDTEKAVNQVFVVDSENMTAPPVAKLTLPQRIPFQLHGNWVPASLL